MEYGDDDLFRNRIQLIATAAKILSEDLLAEMSYDIVLQNPSAELLPAVIPVAGTAYIPGGDKLAFDAASRLASEDVFQRAGLYFQSHLLKALSGSTAASVKAQNVDTRASAIHAVEIIFCLSKSAGIASFTVKGADEFAVAQDYPLVELTGDSLILFESLLAVSRKLRETEHDSLGDEIANASSFSSPSAAATSTAVAAETTGGDSNNEVAEAKEGDDNDNEGKEISKKRKGDGATKKKENHKNNASKKTAKVPDAGKAKKTTGKTEKVEKKEKKGKVEKKETKKEEKEVKSKGKATKQEAEKKIESEEPEWTTTHPSVGTRVAAYFEVDEVSSASSSSASANASAAAAASAKRGQKRKVSKVFSGTVVKYAPESAAGEDDELFHVEWDDGDQQDLDRAELAEAEELYKESEGKKADIRLASVFY
jgi:hypothetical protein